eukprot:scaffold17120_cov118-Isochrysis_galbana.AAC.4
MLSTIDIYNAGAEDPVITHDDALDVVRPKIFAPRDANMDRHQSIMYHDHGSVGAWKAKLGHRLQARQALTVTDRLLPHQAMGQHAHARRSRKTSSRRLAPSFVESEVAHEVNKPRRDEPAACT